MASLSGNNTIVLKGDWSHREEGTLTAAAYPGMNLKRSPNPRVFERDSWTPGSTDFVGTGTGTSTVAPHIYILKEDALQGRTVDDQYAAGEPGFIHICRQGDVIQVLVASGQTVVKGDGLSAVSSGKWNVDATNSPVEALESSGGALAADTLVRVAVL
jgi:hypothetical protein